METVYSCLTLLILCVHFVSSSQVFGTPSFFCGENIDVIPENEVEISTPNFPNPYPSDTNCTWTLCTVNPNHIIVLTFYIFQVERDFNCDSWDFVNIYDGAYIGPNKIATFCGDNSCSGYQAGFYPFDEEIESTGQCMTVNFCSDFLIERLGFLAKINSKLACSA